ncbi:unnamed protein product [Allacma fusca]|uniref:Reverse transcriptase domain-containing protein n=1 Tax=Allacma fusca TaxID=39272 RepID=A0A8J2K1T7_9HEXA|nr:unnamed protein product [Allacma fusca]
MGKEDLRQWHFILDREISEQELWSAVKSLPNKKAVGTDGIPNEVYKALTGEVLTYFTQVLNNVLNEGIPEGWGEIITAPIYKKSCKETPSNYRTISLVNTITKIFTSIISNRIGRFSKMGNVLSDNQAAYCRKKGCSDQVFNLYVLICKQLSKPKGKLFALFVDLSQAFDSITQKKLWKRLSKLGLGSKCIARIKYLYDVARTKIRTNTGYTEFISIKSGILQGESCSPNLFNLYLDEIVEILRNSGIKGTKLAITELQILMYADDLVLVAETASELQQQVNVLKEFVESNNLRINLLKTKVIVFPKDHFKKKANIAQAELVKLIYSSQTSNVQIITRLFTTFVNSTLLYCSPIWALDFVDDLEKLQTAFLRRLCNVCNLVPGYILRLETGAINIKKWIFKATLSLMRKSLNQQPATILRCSMEEILKIKSGKYSWINKVATLFLENGLQDEFSKISGEYLNTNFQNIIGKYGQKLIDADVRDMLESQSLTHYRILKRDVNISQIYLANIQWNAVKLLQNLRTGFPYICVKGKSLNLRGMWLYWKGSEKSPNCELCNLDEPEDLFHVMFKCHHYKSPRRRFLPNLEKVTREDFIIQLFSPKVQKEELMNYYYFWCEVQRTRNFFFECIDKN